MGNIFFDNWESLVRTIVITILAYVGLIILLRISGKRTLSKMNAFDFIVTIALGSTLATVMLNKDVALADGLLALALLIFLQYIITKIAVRNKKFSNLIKSEPALVVYKGEMLREMMLKERIAEDEIYAIIRQNGLDSVGQVDAVIIESDGSLAVIKQLNNTDTETMKNIIKT